MKVKKLSVWLVVVGLVHIKGGRGCASMQEERKKNVREEEEVAFFTLLFPLSSHMKKYIIENMKSV